MTTVKPEPEFHYVWATPLRPHEFLATCTPYNKSGGFRAPVEVVIFPATASPGYEVLSSREYLEKGADLDEGAAAVRFNADTVEPFSIIWAPEQPPGDGEAVGRIHAIGPKSVATAIMREMIEKSSTPRARRRVDAVLAEGERLNGSNSPLSPRPTLADAGLVKSVSVPPGRLRMLSCLDGEILGPDIADHPGSRAHKMRLPTWSVRSRCSRRDGSSSRPIAVVGSTT